MNKEHYWPITKGENKKKSQKRKLYSKAFFTEDAIESIWYPALSEITF